MTGRRIETAVVHAGRAPSAETGAVVPPIELSTTFARGEDGALVGDFSYSRSDNPNRRALEVCLAALEGGADAACFASGSAAWGAVLQALPPGALVLLPGSLYYGSRALLERVFDGGRLRCASVDMGELAGLEARLAQEAPALVLVETPSNPLLQITDIAAVVARARAAGSLVVVDNTWATPLLQRPLALGADLVLHATTKALAGHSDVTGGALVTGDATSPLWARLRDVQRLGGAVPSPFDCWLTLRGVSTLALRLRAQCDNAEALARALASHPAIERVCWPGLDDHPGAAVAARQMSRPGAMLALLHRGGEAGAAQTLARLRLILRATSLGGVHTLAEHRYRVEGPASTTPRSLIRISVGIEHADDLIEDLVQALG